MTFTVVRHVRRPSVAQCLAHLTADVKISGSNLTRNVSFVFYLVDVCLYITHVCSLVLYNGLWLSGFSCLFLLQKYWSMLKVVVVGSNPATGSYSYYSVYTNKKFSHPSSLSYCMYVQLPHLGKKCCTT